MAERSTLAEAQKLIDKWQVEYPDRQFRIIDNSYTGRVGVGVARSKGFEIVEDGYPMVTAKVTSFGCVEVRQCQDCGTEITTSAIGEDGVDQCPECRERARVEYAAESARREEISRQQIAEWEARDRWEEQ